MTTYTIYASSPTGYIQSIDNTSEADAANGLGDDTFAEAVDGGTILVSVFNVGSPYEANEGFLTFDTSGVSGAVTDADLSLYVETVLVDTAGTLQVRLHDFGASITTADWVNRAGLPGKTLLGEWDYTGSETSYQTFTDIAFAANINQSGSTRVLLHDESLLTTLASGSNVLQFADQTASGTTQDPKLVIEAGGSPQDITGALYTNSNTFYGATVGRGTVTITGALVSNAQTFYAATVGRGAVDIAGALFTNSPAFYGATITTGAVIISGELFANGQTFYGATLSPGAVGIAGALFENTNTFYAATVAGEAATQDIAGELVSNVSVFYGATLTTSNEIQGALYANDNTFFGATIEGEAVAQTDRGGDGFGGGRQRRKLRHVTAERLQELFKVEPAEKAPEPTHKRVRAVKREIIEAVEAGGLLGPARGPVTQFINRELPFVYLPSMGWGELASAIQGFMQRVAEEAARVEQEIEDEDEMILLMAA